MSKEREKLSKFIKDLVGANRYNSSVRNLTIYSTLLLQYIGGMLRKYLKGMNLTGFLKSKIAESLNNCSMTYEILRTIDEGGDGKGNMCVVRWVNISKIRNKFHFNFIYLLELSEASMGSSLLILSEKSGKYWKWRMTSVFCWILMKINLQSQCMKNNFWRECKGIKRETRHKFG